MAEVAEVCADRGAGLALVSVSSGQSLAWGIESALVDGFLLRCSGRDLLVEVARRRGLPFVALSLDSGEPDVPAIDIDDFGGTSQSARHLLGLGHRQFAIPGIGLGDGPGPVPPAAVRATRYVNVRERARGFWAALAEAGIDTEEVPVGAVRNGAPNIAEVMEVIWDKARPRPTAILAMADYVALAALEWLAAQGVRVPEDVSVVGFDGVPEAAESVPPLTTVEQPYRRIAERSVAAILDGAMPQGREVLPLTLVVRGSSGPPPSG